jgi:hypothetical protein
MKRVNMLVMMMMIIVMIMSIMKAIMISVIIIVMMGRQTSIIRAEICLRELTPTENRASREAQR